MLHKTTYHIFFFVLLLFLSACQTETKEETQPVEYTGPTLFTELENTDSGLDFTNNIVNTADFNIFNYRNFYNGGGVAIGDINNDGLSDVYLTANLGENKLFLNKGNLQFEDISEFAGITLANKWSTGVTMIDINADGLLDIYVCNAGAKKGTDQKNSLFINQGNNTFSEEAEAYQLDQNDYSTHAAFFDYDMDGDLDVYLLNNSFIPVNTLNYSNKRDLRAKDWPVADFLKGGGDRLLRNDAGVFNDVSETAGIYGSLIGFGLGATIGDVNNDNLPDIYVSNDFFERDYLYINQGNGTFSEELEKRIKHISHSSMGADMADINNDGSPEIFVTDMLPDDEYRLKTTTTFDNINIKKIKTKNGFYNQYMHNTLQLNTGDGKFKEIAFYADVAASDWSWGALMFDGDNDGFNDLFVCNGILNDVIDQDFIDFFANDIIQKMVLSGTKGKVDSIISHMPSQALVNKFYRNTGSLKFEEQSQQAGFNKATFSNGAAYGDLDNDGDLDLIVNNVNQPAQLFKNNSKNAFTGLKLNFEEPNKFAIGSKVYVHQGESAFFKELIPSRGFQSSIDYKMVFGLGQNEEVDSVIVVWPNQKYQKFNNISAGKYNTLTYDVSKTYTGENSNKGIKPIFTRVKHDFQSHEEDDYIDFYYERNIPTELSKEGPCVAKGDFNGDGLEDLYIGGATNQTPTLYRNTGKKYIPQQVEYFEKFKAFEDTEAVFFDADGDGDQDLIVGSGGNNVTYNKRAFRDRLYINTDGKFEINFNALPPVTLNTSKIIPFDFDNDGDLDLFVGMRSLPGEYGASPGSHVYLNNGKGQFLDVTKDLVPELSLAGMVTDAIWADILPNPGNELVLVGEWMSPKVLSFDGRKFNIIPSKLDEYSGWWQSVTSIDIDKDGNNDLVLGNIGENFSLKASQEEPLFLWINDFDDNGAVEKLITRRKDGKDRTVFVKRDLTDQMPGLRKQNLLHSEFAEKGLADLFDKEIIERSVVKKVNYMSSIVAMNDGNGNFEIKKLNREVQLSSINGLLNYDVNKDGFEDLILGGNNEYLLPQFSSIDACSGKILINDNGKGFIVVEGVSSGLDNAGVVRNIEAIDYQGKPHILFLINDNAPALYKLNDY